MSFLQRIAGHRKTHLNINNKSTTQIQPEEGIQSRLETNSHTSESKFENELTESKIKVISQLKDQIEDRFEMPHGLVEQPAVVDSIIFSSMTPIKDNIDQANAQIARINKKLADVESLNRQLIRSTDSLFQEVNQQQVNFHETHVELQKLTNRSKTVASLIAHFVLTFLIYLAKCLDIFFNGGQNHDQ